MVVLSSTLRVDDYCYIGNRPTWHLVLTVVTDINIMSFRLLRSYAIYSDF